MRLSGTYDEQLCSVVSEKVTECKKELQYLEEQVKYTEDFQSYAKVREVLSREVCAYAHVC